jgi:hypothetical protein
LQTAGAPSAAPGEVAVAWTLPRPGLSEVVDFPDLDLFEVQILRRLGGPQLRAAVELVGPANKDRPSNRHAFAVKCASYLNRGVSVVLIDVNTERVANMHAAVINLMGLTEVPAWQSPTHLSVVSYRMMLVNGKHRLDAWHEALAVGAPLPTAPLWLDADLHVPLDLEPTYGAACEALRIPDEGE